MLLLRSKNSLLHKLVPHNNLTLKLLLLNSQHADELRQVPRRWGPLQPDVGAVDDAELLGPRGRTAAVNGTGAAVPAAEPIRSGAPSLQAAERHKQTGKEAEARDADAMMSLLG